MILIQKNIFCLVSPRDIESLNIDVVIIDFAGDKNKPYVHEYNTDNNGWYGASCGYVDIKLKINRNLK